MDRGPHNKRQQKRGRAMGAGHSSSGCQKFHNPYHFVPVRKPDFDPKKGLSWLDIERSDANRGEGLRKGIREKGYTHDRYLPDRFHGRIICSLTTKTPIFVGARRASKDSDTEPARVAPFELAGRPAIPASTLRGMISSVLEAASNSALRVLEKKMLSVRKPPEKPLRKIGIVKVKKIEEGRKRYFVFPLHPQKIKAFRDGRDSDKKPLITYSKKNPQFYLYKSDHNGEPILRREESVPEDDRASCKKGIVRHFPFPPSKWDLFLPFEGLDNEGLIEIPDKVVKKFLSLANERAKACKKGDKELFPYLPKGALRNENGRDDVMVELKTDDIIFFDRREISEIAFSSIWRMSCGGTVHDFFSEIHPELLPFNPERQKVSPAELIFGFVEDWTDKEKGESDKALAYAGRVRFSHGILQEEKGKEPYMDEVTLKILASPKPPCPCMYFYDPRNSKRFIAKHMLKDQNNGTDSNYLPKGRKFYLHHNLEIEKQLGRSDKNGRRLPPWETHPKLKNPKNKDSRLKQKSAIKPVRQDCVYIFHVDFENLSKAELGLLLYSLSPKDNFLHKIGMGKPLGLGSVKIKCDSLRLIAREKRYLKQDPFDDGSKRYQDENKMTPKDFLDTLKKDEKDVKDILKALEQIGNPKMVKARVHTPLTVNQRDEREEIKTYMWFENNSSKQLLTLPVKNGDCLPTLIRN